MPTTDLNDRDVEIIARIVDLFERRIDTDLPQYGDAAEIWHPVKGKLYPQAHIEHHNFHKPDWMSICTQPMVPFCWTNMAGDRLTFDTSGSYWQGISPEQQRQFQRIGKIAKPFWTWGSAGPRASGGVYLEATVNLWRYTDSRFY